MYSAIFGGKDSIRESQPNGYDYVLFSDTDIVSDRWVVRRVDGKISPDASKCSRFFKLMPHRHLADYDYSIFIDGNMELIRDPAELVDKFLAGVGHFHAQQAYNVALYAPPGMPHFNIYHEAAHCIRLQKDNPGTIMDQVNAYREEGFPESPALWLGGIIIRQHGHPCSVQLGEAWFHEIMTRSRRDQISLPYVLWKTGIEIHTIDPSYEMTKRFPHLHRN